ncbi:hypothetical protein Pmani_023318 [Petrolisthes manimaculis]|uniref:Uncharacterized protein n=1 Tax=Petrolisthes manimaculis TaxID=1843537 RepID=A0AAE1P9X0_9EUCA|nr:hypothetical protein Pmani_023318 [Petrolisthes manimaculis]
MTFQTVLVYLVATPVVITDEVGDGGDVGGGAGGWNNNNNNNTTEQLNWINLLKTAGVDVTLATTTTTTTTLGTSLDDDVAGGVGCGNLVSCQPPLEEGMSGKQERMEGEEEEEEELTWRLVGRSLRKMADQFHKDHVRWSLESVVAVCVTRCLATSFFCLTCYRIGYTLH